MRKRGFSIIELVVALAILFTGITTFGIISTAAMNASTSNKTKIANLNYAETIANVFKANGKLMAKHMYDTGTKDSSRHVSYYLFFDDQNELETKLAANDMDLPVADDSGTLAVAKANNSGNKAFSAYISIYKYDDIDGYQIDDGTGNDNHNINFYGVLIRTWSLSTNSAESSLKIFLGR